MSEQRPLCRYCGRKIPKAISHTLIRNEEMAGRGILGSSALTVPTLPRTKEEAQRLVNWTVTRCEYLTDGQSDPGGIFAIYGWDGQSYAPRHGHFCKIECAARFGRAMADRGAML